MKKMLMLITLFAVIATSCKKTIIEKEYITLKDTLTENGFKWAGWYINNPPTKLDITGERIYIQDSTNNGYLKLPNIALPHSGPRYVYAVHSFIQGSLAIQRADLERRGWKMAPLSYLIGLAKEYSTWNNNYYWNTFCLDVPIKINFGAGDETTAISLSGNTWNQYTNVQYAAGIQAVSALTSFWGQVSILAYK